jgi:hypothetical protein
MVGMSVRVPVLVLRMLVNARVPVRRMSANAQVVRRVPLNVQDPVRVQANVREQGAPGPRAVLQVAVAVAAVVVAEVVVTADAAQG